MLQTKGTEVSGAPRRSGTTKASAAGQRAPGELFPAVWGLSEEWPWEKAIMGHAFISVFRSGFQDWNTEMREHLPVLPENESSKNDSSHSLSPHHALSLC